MKAKNSILYFMGPPAKKSDNAHLFNKINPFFFYFLYSYHSRAFHYRFTHSIISHLSTNLVNENGRRMYHKFSDYSNSFNEFPHSIIRLIFGCVNRGILQHCLKTFRIYKFLLSFHYNEVNLINIFIIL